MISQAYDNSFSMSDKVLAIGMVATGRTMSHMQTLFFPSNHYVLNIFFFLGLFMSKWIYCNSGTITRNSGWFLENGVGDKSKNTCDAYTVFWKRSGKLSVYQLTAFDIIGNSICSFCQDYNMIIVNE